MRPNDIGKRPTCVLKSGNGQCRMFHNCCNHILDAVLFQHPIPEFLAVRCYIAQSHYCMFIDHDVQLF